MYRTIRFWENSGYTFKTFAEVDEGKLLILVNGMKRQDIIKWLMWNDHNGIYSDEQSLKEFGKIMSKEEGFEIMVRQIDENRVVKS